MSVRSNYSFCVDWAQRRPGSRVLDYGCGAGEIVLALREQGFESYGCDVYYEGGDRSRQVAPLLYEQGVLRRMEANVIPFNDEAFDLVISNQVLEHVESLEFSLTEIARVLKPGGKVLSLLPHREAWFEGHVGLPFVHWFASGSRSRRLYTVFMRMLGFGFFKAEKPIAIWSRDALAWIDRWTHYRSRREIDHAFARHFRNSFRLEASWLQHKLSEFPIARTLPAWSRQLATTLLVGLVFECEKPSLGAKAKTLPHHVPSENEI